MTDKQTELELQAMHAELLKMRGLAIEAQAQARLGVRWRERALIAEAKPWSKIFVQHKKIELLSKIEGMLRLIPMPAKFHDKLALASRRAFVALKDAFAEIGDGAWLGKFGEKVHPPPRYVRWEIELEAGDEGGVYEIDYSDVTVDKDNPDYGTAKAKKKAVGDEEPLAWDTDAPLHSSPTSPGWITTIYGEVPDDSVE